MGTIIDDPVLREKRQVFSGRRDAGQKLASLVRPHVAGASLVVLAIPAGGVPVGVGIALALHAPFAPVIVRKVRIPGNTEAGFGAVTWDGRVLINERLRDALGLSPADVDAAVAATRHNVKDRVARFTAGRKIPDLAGRTAILVDDGLASGFTMLAALASTRPLQPARVLVAVPTASAASAALVARQCDALICANIRSGGMFAVADAYKDWYDLDDREVLEELARV